MVGPIRWGDGDGRRACPDPLPQGKKFCRRHLNWRRLSGQPYPSGRCWGMVPTSSPPAVKTPSTQSVEVVVVGGGMVGLTLACALAGTGVEVAVIERADPAALTGQAFDGRVSAIALASQRGLEVVGVWPRLNALGDVVQPIHAIRVSDGDSLLFLHYDRHDLDEGPLGFIVENRHLRTALVALADRTPGLALFAPRRLTAMDRTDRSVSIALDDGASLSARLAVAADGRRSALRRAAGITTMEWTYPQTGIVCTVAHERAHRGIAHERFLPAGPFAILPITGDRSSLVWTERSDTAPAVLPLNDAEFGDELAARFGEFLGRLEVVGPRWHYPLSLVHADRYTARRLVLVGDAAHAIHPIAGQGLNLGLRDVGALAEVVVDARRLGLDIGDPGVLVRYQDWRRFDNLLMMAVTDGLNRLFSNELAPVKLARDLGLAAVNRLPPLKRLFMRHAMGLAGELPRLWQGRAL